MIAAGIWFFSSPYHYGRFNYGGGAWFMPYGMMAGGAGVGLVMFLFWIIVIVSLAVLVSGLFAGRSDARNACGNWSGPDAVEILKRRYARGEINKVEYEQMRHELTA